ncbi:hypothetical protein ACWDUN_04030 [Mycobacterium sp. NPDC003323]
MTVNPEQIFEVARRALAAEVREMVNTLAPRDLTASELAALVTLLRPPYERFTAAAQAQPAPVLELVPSARKRSGKGK